VKISTILNEATIKVPEEAYKDLMNIVCSDLFSRIFNYLDDATVQDNYPELDSIYRQLAKKYTDKYGRFKIHAQQTDAMTMKGVVHVRMAEVDPRYFKNNPQAKNKTYTLGVVIGASEAPQKVPTGEYNHKTPGRPARMVITLPDSKHLSLIARSPELFEGMITRIEGVVQHELMHGIQDMALGQIKGEAEKYYTPDGELDREKYFTSDVEFSPQIVSAANDFAAFVKEIRGVGYSVSPETVKALMLHYINPTSPAPAGVETDTSEFFHRLYKSNPGQWKKAVKYFYGLVQKSNVLV